MACLDQFTDKVCGTGRRVHSTRYTEYKVQADSSLVFYHVCSVGVWGSPPGKEQEVEHTAVEHHPNKTNLCV